MKTQYHHLIQQCLSGSKISLPNCYVKRAVDIITRLESSEPFPRLGGIKIKRRKRLIRFKIGREYRLLVEQREKSFVPLLMTTRQDFERELRRR